MFSIAGIILVALIFIAAILYSSVGHAGASGYLAAMALIGVAPAQMKPSALILNVLVASIATFQFARAGHFRWRLFLPFAIASVPAAYLGGAITLPGRWYKVLVGAVLLFAAIRMLLMSMQRSASEDPKPPPIPVAMLAGAALGFLAGLTGTGGGIFLSPLLLLMGWAGLRQTSAVAAAFILVNSIAGLVGALPKIERLPSELPLWAIAAVSGGLIGSYIGSRRLQSWWLRRLLAVVLVVAGLKLIFT